MQTTSTRREATLIKSERNFFFWWAWKVVCVPIAHRPSSVNIATRNLFESVSKEQTSASTANKHPTSNNSPTRKNMRRHRWGERINEMTKRVRRSTSRRPHNWVIFVCVYVRSSLFNAFPISHSTEKVAKSEECRLLTEWVSEWRQTLLATSIEHKGLRSYDLASPAFLLNAILLFPSVALYIFTACLWPSEQWRRHGDTMRTTENRTEKFLTVSHTNDRIFIDTEILRFVS